MKKYTIYLGLNDKDTKLQIVHTQESQSLVMDLVATYFGGGSVSLVNGVFAHDDGTRIRETTIKIETLAYSDIEQAKQFCESLKEKFNQESVLLEVSEVQEYFI